TPREIWVTLDTVRVEPQVPQIFLLTPNAWKPGETQDIFLRDITRRPGRGLNEAAFPQIRNVADKGSQINDCKVPYLVFAHEILVRIHSDGAELKECFLCCLQLTKTIQYVVTRHTDESVSKPQKRGGTITERCCIRRIWRIPEDHRHGESDWVLAEFVEERIRERYFVQSQLRPMMISRSA
ncbi:hypothetical protein MELA_02209, partial [Candidatus Methylomirabilis lanthanidiphila]